MKKLVLLSTMVLLGLSACLAESQNNWFDQSQDHVNHETSETTHSSHSREEETSESSESNESSNSSEFRESSESSTEETVDPVDAILNGDYSSLVGVWDYPDGSSFKQADIVTVVLPDGYRLKVDSNGNTRGVEQLIGASEAIQSVIYFRNSTKTEKVDVIKLSVASGFMGVGGYVPLLYPAGWQVGLTAHEIEWLERKMAHLLKMLIVNSKYRMMLANMRIVQGLFLITILLLIFTF